jgi:hypothetical protein
MSTRTGAVLERLPGYIAAGDPGKVFGGVVDALASDLDVQSSQLRDIRRAHRLPDAPTIVDILGLAGMHDIHRAALALLTRRLAARTTPAPYAVQVDAARKVVRAIIETHTWGNATVAGLLDATAAYLATEVVHVDDREDGYWHLAHLRDLLPPDRDGGAGGAPRPAEGAPAGTPPQELMALEENPFQAADIAPAPRRHGDRVLIVRSGFDVVPVSVVVVGIEDRTLAPMVVALHAGAGVVYDGSVTAGSKLRFERDGRVTLDGASVAHRCWRFDGAVFADVAAPSSDDDFCWVDTAAPAGPQAGDRAARFAVASPVDGFAPSPHLPHADDLLRPLSLPTGESRWAAFVGAGVFSLHSGDTDILPQPSTYGARWDRSVFDPDRSSAGAPSLALGWDWEEREPFALRVWLPMRYADLDVQDGASVTDADRLPPVREVVRLLLDRHRAAGVHVYTAYADPRWILATGVIHGLQTEDPLGLVVAGTETWAHDTTQPQ